MPPAHVQKMPGQHTTGDIPFLAAITTATCSSNSVCCSRELMTIGLCLLFSQLCNIPATVGSLCLFCCSCQHALPAGLAEVYCHGVAAALHAAGSVDGVTKEAVAWTTFAHHTTVRRACSTCTHVQQSRPLLGATWPVDCRHSLCAPNRHSD